ncbi:aa3-type cytochrome c oxidase subunit IV [Oceanicella sp. SM1341]|nr:aa3-type cytochrome c oxidase subunit IV [Oceanicella sp. SM1341]
MAHHEHGHMNIEQQQHTFHGFLRITQWVVGLVFVLLLLLAAFNS